MKTRPYLLVTAVSPSGEARPIKCETFAKPGEIGAWTVCKDERGNTVAIIPDSWLIVVDYRAEIVKEK